MPVLVSFRTPAWEASHSKIKIEELNVLFKNKLGSAPHVPRVFEVLSEWSFYAETGICDDWATMPACGTCFRVLKEIIVAINKVNSKPQYFPAVSASSEYRGFAGQFGDQGIFTHFLPQSRRS